MNKDRYRDTERRLWESVGVTPTEQRVHLERADVTVRVQEVGDGPPVVFVHGVNNSGSSWAALVAQLDGFHCVVLDRPGTGLSDSLGIVFDGAESFATFADTLLIDVLDAMGLESAHLVATSFGGYFALRAAAAQPDRIRRMVEFGWTFGAATSLPAFMRFAGVPGAGRLFAAMPLNERVVRAMLRRIGLRRALDDGRFSQQSLDWYVALLRDTDTMRNEMAASRSLVSPWRGVEDGVALSDSLLASIQTPTYFLWGEEDPFGGVGVARQLVAKMPNAELELMSRAGHAVWIDDPEHAAKTTSRFLSR